jgi:hypothetical protein
MTHHAGSPAARHVQSQAYRTVRICRATSILILAQQLRAELPIPVEIAALRHLPESGVEG